MNVMTHNAMMPSPPASATSTNALIRRLRKLVDLHQDEIGAIEDLAAGARLRPAHSLLSAGPGSGPGASGQPAVPQVVLSGWGCRQWFLRDGRCQIVSFLLPGDCIGLQTAPNEDALCSAIALTPMTTADADLFSPSGLARMPGLSRAVTLMKGLDEYLMRCHVVRLGRQTAYERTVHLMLELEARLAMIGQVTPNGFAMPLTQETLSDSLGLSIVHLNRTLQQIRRDGLLEWRGGQITMLRRDAMEAIADWTPLVPARRPAFA
jgi:CRP-like cAMP-binding protein